MKSQKTYVVESFEPTLPRYRLRKRLSDYLRYLAFEWIEGDDLTPTALLILPTLSDLIYAKRRLKLLMSQEVYFEDLKVFVTTREKVEMQSLLGAIWESIDVESY